MALNPLPELAHDEGAIRAFVDVENARTDAALDTAQRKADEGLVRAILESPDSLQGLTRREGHIYTFRQTPSNPRGLWLRLPEHIPPTPDAAWEMVFDLDAFCAAEGKVWVWRGTETSALAPGRVLLKLSFEGADLTRHLEFDLSTKAPVPGGFDLGPDRSGFAWAGPDLLIWSSAAEGDATGSGWPGVVRHLPRGMALADAPEQFRARPEHLLCMGWAGRAGGPDVIEGRMLMTAIGKSQITLIRPGQPDFTLPAPADTTAGYDHRHCAWIAQEDGPHPSGTLVLSRFDSGAERVLFTPAPGRAASNFFFSQNHLLWTETDWLVPRIMALDLDAPGAQPAQLPLPVTAETLHLQHFDADPDAGDGRLMLQLSGFLTPPQLWTCDLARGVAGIDWQPLYAQPARFDASGCEVRLLKATSADGTEVPYHLVLPKGHEGRDDLPVLQYGYGGFGVSLSPWYDPVAGKLWIERSGAYVLAYIRGGAELGPDWHLVAKGAGRRHSYDDFAAIARDLVARGLTRPDRIACHGGSNGGLLCGVMLTQYPQDFGAVWASVGVHDLLGFADFPAGRGWIDEYGDPDDPEAAKWLRGFSPLHNMPVWPIPPALIDTSHRDDRVDPSHSRRFAAALRLNGQAPFYYEHQGGHGGGGASTEKAREAALGHAFLRHALKLDTDAPT